MVDGLELDTVDAVKDEENDEITFTGEVITLSQDIIGADCAVQFNTKDSCLYQNDFENNVFIDDIGQFSITIDDYYPDSEYFFKVIGRAFNSDSEGDMDLISDSQRLMDLVTDKEMSMDKVTDKEMPMEKVSDKALSWDKIWEKRDNGIWNKGWIFEDVKNTINIAKFVQGGAFIDSTGVSSENVSNIDTLTDNNDRMEEVTDSERAMDGATESEIAMDKVTDKEIAMDKVSDKQVAMDKVTDKEMPMDKVTDKEMPMDKVYSKQMPLEKFFDVTFPISNIGSANVEITFEEDRIKFERSSEADEIEFPLILAKTIDFTDRDNFNIKASADTLGENTTRFKAHIRIGGDTVLELDGSNDDFEERNIDTSTISGRQSVEFGYNASSFGDSDSYIVQYGRFITNE